MANNRSSMSRADWYSLGELLNHQYVDESEQKEQALQKFYAEMSVSALNYLESTKNNHSKFKNNKNKTITKELLMDGLSRLSKPNNRHSFFQLGANDEQKVDEMSLVTRSDNHQQADVTQIKEQDFSKTMPDALDLNQEKEGYQLLCTIF